MARSNAEIYLRVPFRLYASTWNWNPPHTLQPVVSFVFFDGNVSIWRPIDLDYRKGQARNREPAVFFLHMPPALPPSRHKTLPANRGETFTVPILNLPRKPATVYLGNILTQGCPPFPPSFSTNGVRFLLSTFRNVRPMSCYVAPASCTASFHDSCVSGSFGLVDWTPIARGVIWTPQRDINRWMDTLQVGQYEGGLVTSSRFGWL